MKRSIPLRLRVTLVCGVVLAACCLLLTLTHSHYAYEMADAIEAIPLEPDQAAEMTQSRPMEQITLAQEATRPARQAFRFQSLAAMAVIVVLGCGMVYWLTGKALAPLHQLDAQIRGRTAADLGRPLPVPASADEVAGLTVSFNQMSQNLSRAFEQQKRFSQCAAHELRTPLAILKTRMSLFRKKGLCSTAETAALLDVLEEQTDRLSALVGDLLALANMEELERSQRVDVVQLLKRTAESLRDLANAHQVRLELDAVPGTVPGNAALLERALFNLGENAVKYNRPGGTVTIRSSIRGDTWQVEVADQGSGIPEALLEQVFEPFFRVDPSRSRQLGGAGLGLSLVRSIASLHGGQVRAESSEGHGCRFILTLPDAEGPR